MFPSKSRTFKPVRPPFRWKTTTLAYQCVFFRSIIHTLICHHNCLYRHPNAHLATANEISTKKYIFSLHFIQKVYPEYQVDHSLNSKTNLKPLAQIRDNGLYYENPEHGRYPYCDKNKFGTCTNELVQNFKEAKFEQDQYNPGKIRIS